MMTVRSISKKHLIRLFTQVLGQELPEKELEYCLRQAQFFEPVVGRKFWQTTDDAVGVYIVLDGKVRLVDEDDQLLASLGTGASFGELSLFAEDSFQSYIARGSTNLQLCYISGEGLKPLFRKYPSLKEHFYRRAALLDLVVLFTRNDILQSIPLQSLMYIFSLLRMQKLSMGTLSTTGVEDQKFWLVRTGEITNTSGQRLVAGSLCDPSQLSDAWRVTQPTEIYSLDQIHWASVESQVPQLLARIDSDNFQFVSKSTVGASSRRRKSNKSSSSDSDKESLKKAYFPTPKLKLRQWWQRVTQRYPFFEQQSSSDCGVACLVMIGRYWGKQFSVNRLRELANIDRNGASLKSLVAAAESIGFSTRPVKASIKNLTEQNLPAILHWEGKHYVVVYKVTSEHVILVDPALGQRKLSHLDFLKGWKGYSLLLQPTALFGETKEQKQSLWRFFGLVKPHWVPLLEILMASITIQIFGLVTPFFTQLLLDRVIVQRSELTLTAIGSGLLIFGVFRVIMIGLRQYLIDHTANKVDLSLIVGFISHTFRLPLKFFESRYVGDIISRVEENRKIQRFFTSEVISVFLDLLTVFVYVGVMFYYSWQMAFLALTIVPPMIILTAVFTPILQRVSREIFNAYNKESSYLIEAITGIRTVKSLAIERNTRWHWEELLSNSIRKGFSGQIIGNTLQISSGLIETLATSALLWFGAWQVIHDQLTIGQLVAFNILLGSVIGPFKRLTSIWNEFQEVVIAVERINDVLEAEPEEDLQHSRQVLPPIQGHVRFDKVTFRYHPESDLNTLENVSFEIKPGQTVALVGRSGSGKTTISKLVLGLYPPTEGIVSVDGVDIGDISLGSLRQQIGVVNQDTFLFGGTIRENISVAKPEATLEEVTKAAGQAGADQFIKELPMGYETEIGEAGGLLSGGQRQRLAIARALLGDPKLLILDEATSSLDAESERIIQDNLNTVLKDRTTLVIAHRLSTIRNADLILVLDRGILIEQGTHQELMDKRGHYFYFNQQQFTTVTD
jgi:HlyB family type I secretion system ABC transporter